MSVRLYDRRISQKPQAYSRSSKHGTREDASREFSSGSRRDADPEDLLLGHQRRAAPAAADGERLRQGGGHPASVHYGRDGAHAPPERLRQVREAERGGHQIEDRLPEQRGRRAALRLPQ